MISEEFRDAVSEVVENWRSQRLAAKISDVVEIAAFVWLLHVVMNIAEFLDQVPEMAADATVEQAAELALMSSAFSFLIVGFFVYYVLTRHAAPILGFAVEAIADAVKDAQKEVDQG